MAVDNSSNVTNKTVKTTTTDSGATGTDAKNPFSKLNVVQGTQKNVLNNYRSSNYIFTLAALDIQQLNDPRSYRDSTLKYVILKSGGKGNAGISNNVVPVDRKYTEKTETTNADVKTGQVKSVTTSSAEKHWLDESGGDLVDGFNKHSPGRFDMFIDNLEMDSQFSFKPGSDVSLVTKLAFDVIEPYSINGFIEALQVAAVAAGYPTYTQACFLLKMQFAGYPDGDGLPDIVPEINYATRYFVIRFQNLEVSINERGTVYKCTAIPYNEIGFGNAGILKKPTKIEGKTVFDILKNLMDTVQDQVKKDAELSLKTKPEDFDEYKIKFPTWDSQNGFDGGTDSNNSNDFGKSSITELTRNNIYKMPDPATTTQPNATKSKGQSTPTPEQNAKAPAAFKISPNGTTAAQFSDGKSLIDCVSAIIRDSVKVRDIIKKLSGSDAASVIDDYGMVDYFIIKMELTNKKAINPDTRRPYHIYTYVVTPYKVHYTRIPTFGNPVIDKNKLKHYSLRDYNYIYTGKNLDILNFKLNFNSLFWEAVPTAMGQNQAPPSRDGIARANQTDPKVNPDSVSIAKETPQGVGTVQPTSKATEVSKNSGIPNQTDPYTTLARNMHNAIVNSKSGLLQGEVEILGDPLFLVTGGIGNYNPTPSSSTAPHLTADGEANHNYGEVLVTLNFRNPIDINPLSSGGRYKFDPRLVPFSGVYRVLDVVSTFKDGLFKQRLNVMRIPGQILDNNLPITNPSDKISSVPDPLAQKQEDTSPSTDTVNTDSGVSGSRADTFNLLNQQQRGLPSPGLPGELSNFTNAAGGLGGSSVSLLSQVSGAIPNLAGVGRSATQIYGGVIPGGINQSALGIPLQASGVASLQQQTLGPAALLNQVSNTLRAGGINAPTLQLANSIVSQASNIINQVSAPGSGIGKGALVSYTPATPVSNLIAAGGTITAQDVIAQNSTMPTNITAISGAAKGLGINAISAVANLGPASAILSGGARCVPTKAGLTSVADPLAIAARLGVNPSRIAGLSSNLQSKVLSQFSSIANNIPVNTNLSQVSAQGVNLNSLSASGIASLPPTNPFTTAPDAIPDSQYLDTIGKPDTLARSFGVNSIKDIPQSQLSPSALTEALNSTPSSIKNPLSGLSNIPGVDLAINAGRISSAYSQLSSIVGNNSSVESKQNLLQPQISQIANGSNLSNSVILKYGSLSSRNNPLDKIMLN